MMNLGCHSALKGQVEGLSLQGERQMLILMLLSSFSHFNFEGLLHKTLWKLHIKEYRSEVFVCYPLALSGIMSENPAFLF